MLLLVKTQKKIMLRKRKNLKALAEKAFSDSHFINRDNCIKVFTLAYCYKNKGKCENGEMGTKNLEKVKAHLLCRTEILDIDFPEPFKTIFENDSKCHPSTSGSGGDRQKNKERHNGTENLIGKLMQNMCLNVNGKKKGKGKKHNGTEKAEDDVEEEEEENEEGKGREFHPSSSSSSKSKPNHVRHNSIDDIIDTLVKYHRICDMNKRKKKKNTKGKKGKAKNEELLMGGEGGSEEEEEEEESEEDEEAGGRPQIN
ncbi:hypothetical protein niasHS_008158 [Heterodera schachtii]|uniref:Uncharacterized protein n=1 Tax=Heterodera schachtii TaxID=97005 RepID=A0ABD2J4L4_HETSC